MGAPGNVSVSCPHVCGGRRTWSAGLPLASSAFLLQVLPCPQHPCEDLVYHWSLRKGGVLALMSVASRSLEQGLAEQRVRVSTCHVNPWVPLARFPGQRSLEPQGEVITASSWLCVHLHTQTLAPLWALFSAPGGLACRLARFSVACGPLSSPAGHRLRDPEQDRERTRSPV